MINKCGSGLAKLEERSAFADLMIEILLRPRQEIKEYLGALSQGYFAYHTLALDQNCSDERLQLAKDKLWIFDSSIILALLAINSLNNDYARDLLQRMKSLGFRCVTTERLFYEVQEHAQWAMSNFSKEEPGSLMLLLAAQAGPGYRQNLFIDGFVKWSTTQGSPRFTTYLEESLGKGYSKNLREAIKNQVNTLGIEVVKFDEWPWFLESLYVKRDNYSEQVAESRKNRNTYKSTSQCDAEAEVIIIAENAKSIFLSQSGFLNRFSDYNIVWKPETTYRFLTLFSSVPPETDMLYQCMTQDFFYAGIDIIDEQTISNYASSFIHQARMKLEQEIPAYESILGKERTAELEAGFEQTPDIQKPFYSIQFAYYAADRAESSRKAAIERARSAEEIRDFTQKERKQFERLKLKEQEKKRKSKKTKRGKLKKKRK